MVTFSIRKKKIETPLKWSVKAKDYCSVGVEPKFTQLEHIIIKNWYRLIVLISTFLQLVILKSFNTSHDNA